MKTIKKNQAYQALLHLTRDGEDVLDASLVSLSLFVVKGDGTSATIDLTGTESNTDLDGVYSIVIPSSLTNVEGDLKALITGTSGDPALDFDSSILDYQVVSYPENDLTSVLDDLTDLKTSLSTLLGFRENWKITDHVYEGNRLISAKIKTYEDSSDMDTDTVMASYQMTSTIDGEGRTETYSVVKIEE